MGLVRIFNSAIVIINIMSIYYKPIQYEIILMLLPKLDCDAVISRGVEKNFKTLNIIYITRC